MKSHKGTAPPHLSPCQRNPSAPRCRLSRHREEQQHHLTSAPARGTPQLRAAASPGSAPGERSAGGAALMAMMAAGTGKPRRRRAGGRRDRAAASAPPAWRFGLSLCPRLAERRTRPSRHAEGSGGPAKVGSVGLSRAGCGAVMRDGPDEARPGPVVPSGHEGPARPGLLRAAGPGCDGGRAAERSER